MKNKNENSFKSVAAVKILNIMNSNTSIYILIIVADFFICTELQQAHVVMKSLLMFKLLTLKKLLIKYR